MELTKQHMQELVDFRLFLHQELSGSKRLKRTKETIDLYLLTLKRLMQNAPDLSLEQVNKFFSGLLDKERKGTYLNDYVDILHIYGRFKKTKLYESIRYFAEEEFRAARMSDEEINDFINLPPPSTERYNHKAKKMLVYHYAKGWGTWNMFWKLFAYHPTRPGEIAHLTVDDIDFGLNAFYPDGKTKERELPIHTAILPELKEYIKNLKTDLLFPSRQGSGVVDDVDWGYNFHCRIKRIGIKRKNLRPYSLRHSSITRLADTDSNPFVVMGMAGHKDIKTTLLYYKNSLKKKREVIHKDSLGRKFLEYSERLKMFRSIVLKGLEDFALTPEEEKQMIKALTYE